MTLTAPFHKELQSELLPYFDIGFVDDDEFPTEPERQHMICLACKYAGPAWDLNPEELASMGVIQLGEGLGYEFLYRTHEPENQWWHGEYVRFFIMSPRYESLNNAANS